MAVRKSVVTGVLVALAVTVPVAAWLGHRLGLFAPGYVEVKGKPITETPLVDLAGRHHAFSELRGQPATLYLWATWCGPCLEHLAQYAKNGLPPHRGRFLPVALEARPADVAATLKRVGYRGPAWVATDGMALLQQRFAGNDRRAVPYEVELDADGRIVSARYGG
jgi:thiol-disulfide isomerase/thioredoxin